MLKPYLNKNKREAGCDEAGRGCLAGPVFAAAVILKPGFKEKKLNDSKKMTEKERLLMRDTIMEQAADYAVASVDHTEIDKINILRASIKAMHLALDKIKIPPEFILIDGNRFTPYRNIAHSCIIKGDGIYMSIAAASVLAKCYRDEYMQKIHLEYPVYNWLKNKGYPSTYHRRMIQEHGISPYHRKSFRLLPVQTELNLNYK